LTVLAFFGGKTGDIFLRIFEDISAKNQYFKENVIQPDRAH
jgi:hypothetical protein